MEKLDKNLFKYAIIMICAVLAIILVALFSQSKVSDSESEYKKEITENQKKSEEYQKRLVALEEENKNLKTENKKLGEELSKAGEDAAGQTDYIQQMKTLSDIYLMAESGDKNGAKKELEKLDGIALDETAESFKGAIEKLLK